MAKKVAVIVGSLRKDSLNRKLAKELIQMAPASIKLDIVEIGDLPLYNQDFDDEGQVPVAWTKFREQMKGYQGVLFVTPEYNRSIPAPLKNAIDVGSRPYGQSIWGGKPGAIISLSPGAVGGFGANHQLRQSLVFLDVPTLQQPEAYIGNAGNLFNDKGEIANEDTRKFVQKFIDTYAKWFETNSK
jgi:chromate reductase, NAD(P)H dehydrogenase (quinone)